MAHSQNNCHVIIILGADEIFSISNVYPALWTLFCIDRLPQKITFVGYGNQDLPVEHLETLCSEFIKVEPNYLDKYDVFWKNNYYVKGSLTSSSDYKDLNIGIINFSGSQSCNRVIVVAVSAEYYKEILHHIHIILGTGWNRIIVEKPWGLNLEHYISLDFKKHVSNGNKICLMDPLLSDQAIEDILSVRFCNRILASTWNKNDISKIKITYWDRSEADYRGRIEQKLGVIGEIMMHYLLHLLTLVAMDRPKTLSHIDIHEEKIKVLKCIEAIKETDIVTGRYKETGAVTFAQTIINVKDDKWAGVPFILNCGRGLDENKTEIEIVYKPTLPNLFKNPQANTVLITSIENCHTRLSINFHPGRVSMPLTENHIGSNDDTVELLNDPYSKCFLDVVNDKAVYYYTHEELVEQYRIFSQILKEIEHKRLNPVMYELGSKGPQEAEQMLQDL